MKPRTTLILVMIALVIGAVVALDYYKGTPTEQAETNRKRLFNIEAKDVEGLTIALTNQTYSIEKSGDLWLIKEPIRVRASSSAVNSILDELEFAERSRTIPEKELTRTSLADFGFEKPRAQVTLRTKKGVFELLVGSDTPTKDALYVRVPSQKSVLVAPRSIYERVNHTLDDLRDRVVVDFSLAAATRFEIKSADRVIEVAKAVASTNTEPRWALTRPLTARADQRKVGELLANLESVRVLDFVSEDPKDLHTYQLDEPEREVTVWTGESGKTLLLGRVSTNNADKVYAKLKSADSIFTVPVASAQQFAIQANDLRDSKVLAVAEDDVRGFEVIHGAEKISLVRTGANWRITAPTAVAAEDAVARQLLGRILGLTVKQFAADVATDLDKYGLAAPIATVSLLDTTTNVLAQLLVGAEDDGIRYVKCADEPFVYGVETNMDGWLPTQYLTLRSRRLADLKPDQIIKLTIESGSSKIVVERDADKKWRLVEPSQGVLDTDALQHVLDGWGQLRADEFIHEGRGNLGEYGLDQPAATVSVATGEQNYTLTLGRLQGTDRRYALWGDPVLVLTLSTSLANTFTRSLVTLPTPASPASTEITNAPARAVEPVTLPDAGSPTTNVPAEKTTSPAPTEPPAGQ